MPFIYQQGLPQCRRPGVYLIVNTVNHKVYVGSSWDILKRLWTHRRMLRSGGHFNSHLQSAWNKYGEKAFEFHVVEVCNKDISLDREQHWIDELGAYSHGYNMRPEAESNRGRKYTDEQRERSSNFHKEWAANNPDLMRKAQEAAKAAVSGHKKSSEQRKRNSIAQKKIANPERMREIAKLSAEKTRGKKRSADFSAKLSVALKGRSLSEQHKESIKLAHWSKKPGAADVAEKAAAKQRGVPKHTAEHKKKVGEQTRLRWIKWREERTTQLVQATST